MASFSSEIRGTITNVTTKGFAFADTSRGNVFIPAHVHLALGKPQKGKKAYFRVKQGDKGLVALEPPPRSTVVWNEWQVGETQVFIPDTRPWSDHTVSFACFECGSSIVEGNDIYRIKQASLWTKDISAVNRSLLKLGAKFYNKYKQTTTQAVLCSGCSKSVGAIYVEPYHDADEDTPFPCLKLYVTGERDGMIYNDLVIDSASRQSAMDAISKLELLHPHADGGGSAAKGPNVRTTQRTFDSKKKEEERMSKIAGRFAQASLY